MLFSSPKHLTQSKKRTALSSNINGSDGTPTVGNGNLVGTDNWLLGGLRDFMMMRILGCTCALQ